ncbi:MAG: DUF4190 domain-containing protein [Roseburia sp.]
MYENEMNSYQQPQSGNGQWSQGGNGQWSQGGYGQQPQGGYGQWAPQNKPVGNGLGIASLVLGILSLVLFCSCVNIITGILAIVFGIVQLVKGGNKGMPIAGIVTSAISIIACVVYWVAIMGSTASLADFYSDPSYYMEEYYDDELEYDFDSDSFENMDYGESISL